MINSDLYKIINIADKTADASWKRGEILSNNIANVDTPNYKRKDMRFEEILQSSLAGVASPSQVNLNALEGQVYTDNNGLSYRMDGNNVDIDVENVYFAENQIRYNAIIDSISQDFSRIKLVLNAR